MYVRENVKIVNGRKYSYYSIVSGHKDKNGQVKQKTLLNLGNISKEKADTIKLALSGKTPSELSDILIGKTYEYGASKLLNSIWENLNLTEFFSSTHEYRIKMMVLNRLIEPKSKNALVNWYEGSYNSLVKSSTDVVYENLYRAMDYLEEKQEDIENRLLKDSDKFERIYYDITSSYFEGVDCELSNFGYSRDHRSDKKQIVISLAINEYKRPLAVKVLKGNTADITTIEERMIEFKNRFKLKDNVIVTDKGMVSKDNIVSIKENGFNYILCMNLTKEAKEIVDATKQLEFQIYDDTLSIKEYIKNDEKYIICFSKYKDYTDKEGRKNRITKTEELFKKIQTRISNGQLKVHDKITSEITKVFVRYKAKRYFNIKSEKDSEFEYSVDKTVMEKEGLYDGIFVLKTSILSIDKKIAVDQYKHLKYIERAFREIKSYMDLRPIYHFKDTRVKAHVFICFLSYLVYNEIDRLIKENKIDISVEQLIDNLKKIDIVELESNKKTQYKLSKVDIETLDTVKKIGINDFKQIRL